MTIDKRWWVFATVVAVGCSNAGEDRVLAIDAEGVLAGLVYFDGDGSRSITGADEPLDGVEIVVLARGTVDTVATVTSDDRGSYEVRGLPVGNYDVRVNNATIGDSVEVVEIDTSLIALVPDDSVFVTVIVSFQIRSITEARVASPGERFFVEGIALNTNGGFGDSTFHIADTATAIRATNVARGFYFAGDSIRLLGTRATRDGQPTLDDGVIFALAISSLAPPPEVTSAVAAAAQGGELDAALVKVLEATVADTATVGDDFTLTVDDGSGSLVVVLDVDLNIPSDALLPDSVVTTTGLLVPDGGGAWVLKPRARQDVEVVSPTPVGRRWSR